MPPKRGADAPVFPVATIKKLMQQDEDVGRIAQPALVVTAKVAETFLQDLVNSARQCAEKGGKTTITPEHLKEVIRNNEAYDFLEDVVNAGSGETTPAAGPAETVKKEDEPAEAEEEDDLASE